MILYIMSFHIIHFDYNTIIINFLLNKYFVCLKDLKIYIYIYSLIFIYIKILIHIL